MTFVQLNTEYHKQMGELGLVASQVYVYLGCRINDEDLTWPSERTIAADLRITRAQVQAAIKRLAELGFIKVHPHHTEKQHFANSYTVNHYFHFGKRKMPHPDQLPLNLADTSSTDSKRRVPNAGGWLTRQRRQIQTQIQPPWSDSTSDSIPQNQPAQRISIEQEPKILPPTPTAPPADSGRRTTPSDLSETKKWTPIPPVVHRLEEELGYKLAHPVREARAVHRALALGYTEDQILACWRVLRQGYWRGRYLPLTVVLDNLGEFVAGRLQLEAQEDGRSGNTGYRVGKGLPHVEPHRVEEFPDNARDW